MFELNLGVTCFDTMFELNLGVTCSDTMFELNLGVACSDTMFELNLGVTCSDTIFGLNLGVTCSGVHVNAYAIVSPKITWQFIIELTSIPARMLTHVCLRRVYLHNTQLEYPSSVWQNLDSWLTSNATNHVRLSIWRISTSKIQFDRNNDKTHKIDN